MMVDTEKLTASLNQIGQVAVQAINLGKQDAVLGALADAERALKRIAKRAATLPDEFERVEIQQDRGPTVEFTGRLLADTSFETRRGQQLTMTLEIWETETGTLIAVTASTLPGGSGREDARVTVVPAQEDQQAMRFAVMDAFGWELRARSMVRKLGWSLRMEAV